MVGNTFGGGVVQLPVAIVDTACGISFEIALGINALGINRGPSYCGRPVRTEMAILVICTGHSYDPVNPDLNG